MNSLTNPEEQDSDFLIIRREVFSCLTPTVAYLKLFYNKYNIINEN